MGFSAILEERERKSLSLARIVRKRREKERRKEEEKKEEEKKERRKIKEARIDSSAFILLF